MTQRDDMGREVGEGFRIGNSCTPMEDSKIVKKKKKKKRISNNNDFRDLASILWYCTDSSSTATA